MTTTSGHPVLVVGAGPAGLTAAYELTRNDIPVHVIEQSHSVGGISRTEVRNGYRFDIGGHRFFSKNDEVNALWRSVLGEEFLRVRRLSRIFFGGRFYDYPLNAFRTMRNLGVVESAAILLSYLKAKVRPLPEEKTFEQWVVNRFGRRLFNTFFKTYTEKVWGMRCDQISADWAAQRIKGLSLRAAVIDAIAGSSDAKTLIKEFDYPRFGPGQMWERFRDAICARGGEVTLGSDVIGIHHDGAGEVESVTLNRTGKQVRVAVSHVISSMPLPTLIERIDPAPPVDVLEIARQLRHRDFLMVGLVLKRAELFPDNWVYIHTPGVSVGRIQNFKNWSAHMVPEAGKTSLGMEYFCARGDALWEASDQSLIDLATRELALLGLACAEDVERGVVIRQPMAYPVYDDAYHSRIAALQNYLRQFANLQTVGRNGMHRYNNQDHSMLTGLYAARNVLGEKHDLWSVNTESAYHEAPESNARPMVHPMPAGTRAVAHV